MKKNWKEVMNHLVEENSKLKGDLYGLQKSVDVKNVMLNVIGDIVSKLKQAKDQNSEQVKWYSTRMATLMECWYHIDSLVMDNEGLEQTNMELSTLNDQLLKKVKTLEEQMDMMFHGL